MSQLKNLPAELVSYARSMLADSKVIQPTSDPDANLEYWMRNHYLADPCFILIVEKQFGKKCKDFTIEELARLYPIWEDGIQMGRYCELTKGAEGT